MEKISLNVQLIPVPLKLTDKIDFTNKFKKYFEDDIEDLEKFDTFRQDMRDSGNDTIGINLTYKYFEQLKNLELYLNSNKYPIDIDFIW